MAKIKYWRENEGCYVDADGNRVVDPHAEESQDPEAERKPSTAKGRKQPDPETEKDE